VICAKDVNMVCVKGVHKMYVLMMFM
jgi:hypothetical protein